MKVSILSATKENRNMKFIKALFLACFLTGFVNINVSAQCTVSGVSGSGFLFAGQCAPVTSVLYYEFTFSSLVAPPLTTYNVVYDWGDGVTETVTLPVQTRVISGITVYYVRAELSHTFPPDGLCEYHVWMVLLDNGFQCSDSRQVQYVGNWHEDDVTPANGRIAIDPDREDVCEGLPLIDFQFTDASNYSCNIQDNPLAQKPNHTARYEQFVYGTNPVGGQGIPNLFIKVGTAQTSVRLTNADGSPVLGPWTVDPVTGATVTAYTTQSGYFEGPVVQIPVDPVTGVYALNDTYPISFDGVGTVVDDRFQVTVRNWNVCNPWNGSQKAPNSDIANPAVSYIWIVDGPLANAGPDDIVCEGSTYNMNGVLVDGTSALWTSRGNGSFTNDTSPDNAVYTPGVNDLNRGYVDLVLYAYGTGQCPEHTDTMRLSFDPMPDIPVIDISNGSNGFCDNNSQSLTLRSTVSPNGNYLWLRNGTSIGISTRTLTLNDYSQSGDYTVIVYSNTPNACPRESAPFTVAIYQPATVSDPTNAVICQGSGASFSVTPGGPASAIEWQRFNGTSWADITGSATPNDGCTYSNYTTNTLAIAGAAAAMNGFRYRARVITTLGGCITYSNAASLTVNPLATISTQPVNESVCELSNASFSVTASVGGSSSITGYQWQRRSGSWTNITAATTPDDDCTYGGYNSATLNITSAAASMNGYRYRVIITTTGGCTITSDEATLTVNELADITSHPQNRAICAGSGTTFTVSNDNNPSVTARRWQVSTDGGSTWNNLSNGGIYSGVANATLTLSNVTTAYNTYQYRFRLTTNGPCYIYSNPGLLTVHSLPIDRTVTAADSWLCYNNGTNINLIASENSIIYQLRIGTNNSGGAQTGNGLNLAFPTGNLLTNTTFNIYAAKTTTIGASTLTCYLQMSNTPTVNVNPEITMPNLTHQDICLDGTIDLPSAAASGGTNSFTYNWTGTGGYTNSVQNPVSFAPLSAGTRSYDVEVTDEGFRTISTDNTLCSVTDNISFNVNPLPDVTVSVSDPVICEGKTALVVVSSSVSGTRYQLRLDADDTNVGNPVDGTGSPVTFSVSPLSTTTYNVLATVISTGCDNEVTDKSTVTVNPNPVPAISGPNNVCQFEQANYSTPAIVGHTYQWSTTLGTIISSTTANPVTIQWNSAGSGTVTVTETITATGCTVTTAAYPVTVNPGPPSESPSVVSGAVNICRDGTLNIDVTNVATAIEYIWDFSWVPGNNNAVTTSSQISIDLTGINPGTYWVTVAGSNGCGTGPWMNPPHTFNINDIPDLSPLSNLVCSDEPSGITLSISNPGPTISSLTYNIVSINYGGLTASAGSQATGSGMAAGAISDDAYTNKTAANVDVVYAVVPVSSQGCPGAQENVTLTVRPEPVLAALSTQRCSDEVLGFNLSVAPGSSAAASYNITSINANGLTAAAGSPSTGNVLPANIIADDAWVNTTSSAVDVVYSIVPVGTNNCTGDTYTMTITVNPEPALAESNITRCSDEALGINLSVIAGSVEASVYNITAIDNGGLTASAGSPALGNGLAANVISNDIWTNTTTAPVDVIYTVVPVSAEGCQGNPGTITVTVNPEPILATLSNTVCSDSPAAVTLAVTGSSVAAASYNITNINSGGLTASAGSPATGTGLTANVIENDVWTNKTANPVDVIYTVVPVSSAGCQGKAQTIVITVNPEPVMASSAIIRCSDELLNFNLSVSSGGVAASSFNLTAIENGGLSASAGAPATGTGLAADVISGDAWTNLTSSNVNVVYTVVPVSAAGCLGDAADVTVTVRPDPVITSGQAASACSGNALNYAIVLDNFTNTADNVTFTWTEPVLDPVSPSFSGGTSRNVPSMANITDIFINTLGVIGKATYTVTPYKGGCAGTPVDITINVGSEPVLDPDLDRTVCSNAATGLILKEAPGSVTATYYNILSITREANLAAVAGNATTNNNVSATYLENDRFENTTGVDKTVTYRIQPVLAPDCYGDPVDVVITIHPQPVIVIGQVKTVCSGTAIGKEILLYPANTPGGTLFNWSEPVIQDGSVQGTAGVNVAAGVAGTIHLNDIIYNYSSEPITATYTVTPVSEFGCTGIPVPVIITINQEPVPEPVSGLRDLCVGDKSVVYSVTPIGGSSFHWTVDPEVGNKVFDFNTNAIIIDAAAVAGSGNISVYETNALGCLGDISSLPVQVYSRAIPENINGESDVCALSTHVYSVTNRTGSIYNWTVPGGAAILGDPSSNSITVVFGNSGGTILVRETNIAGCVTNHNPLAVTVNPLPTATISNGGTLCEGSTRPLNVTFTGTAPFSFTYAVNGTVQTSISTNSNPYILDATLAGTYTIVDVTDNSGCTNTGAGMATVIYFPHPTGTISGTTQLCLGSSTTLTMVFTGVAPYTFTYTDGITDMTVSSYPANVYTVNVTPLVSSNYRLFSLTDHNNCSGVLSGSADITVNQPPSVSLTGANLTCRNVPTGAVDMTISGGTAPFTISWTSPNGFTASGEDISDLVEGYYAVTVTDSRGCNATGNITITQPGLLNATLSKTDVTCHGISDGTISITGASGGQGTYEYSVEGEAGWQASGNFTDLPAGTYDVRIRDMANPACSVVLFPDLEIIEPLAIMMITTGDILLDCYGDADGTGSFYVIGGTMPYSFVPGSNTTGGTAAAPGFNSLTFFNAGAGSITFDVVDLKGCSATATINITQPGNLTPGSIVEDQVICYGDDPEPIRENLPATGGPASLVYQWQSSVSNSGPFVNIPGAPLSEYTPLANATSTTYYRRMVSSGYCQPVYSNIVSVVVNPRPVAILTGGETVCPGQSSNLHVNLPAGTGPFTIDIENHGTVNGYISGADIAVTPATTTTYRILRVIDANNCEVISPSANITGTATVVVSALPSIISYTPSPAVCEFSLATFSVVADGTNLTYRWYVNNGTTVTPITNDGTYYGAATPTLQIFNTVRGMNGYTYNVVVSGCGSDVTSADAALTVYTAPEITLHPNDTTICLGQNAKMEADAEGTSITWQWYVNRGSGFVVLSDDGNFSGSSTKTLTITNATSTFNNWIFRAGAFGICGVPVYTNFAVLRIQNPPAVTLQPVSVAVCENNSVTFTGNGSNFTSLQWQMNANGTWTDLADDNVTYIGTGSQQLVIMNAAVTMSGYQYRLALLTGCAVAYTNTATLTVNASPVVDFSAFDPVNVCGGVPLVINGNPSGGSGTFTQHRWTGDVGPLNNYFIQSPTFSSLITGSYNLNYRVTDSKGCTANDDVTVIVDSPSAQFTQDVVYGCSPLAVSFSKDMAGISKWWWNFGDGSPLDSLNANPVHTFVSGTNGSIEYFSVSLKVQSAGGCYAEYSSTVTLYPEIDATFTPDRAIICSGNPINFMALPGAIRYFWEFGDGASGYATNVTSHLYTNLTGDPVVHTVRLTTTSFYTCVDVATFDITVMPTPVPQFTADPGTQIYNAAGNKVTFTNTTNAGSWNWLWRFGDNSTSTDMNPVHNYTDIADYPVTLIAANANCSDSVQHTVTVVPLPPVADFDSIPSGCAPLYIETKNTSSNTGISGTTYKWDFGDGSTSTAKDPTYTYFTEGTYRIELVVTGPGGTSMKTQIVKVYPSPKAYFEITPTTVYVNDERIRCFNLSQGADSYVWDFGDGDTSKVKEPYHRYMEEGDFNITLWAYSDNGCSDKYILSPGVTVEPAGELRFSTAFTPNKTGPIERTDLPTGGKEVDQFFYPAVRQKVLTYKLQIFNRLGVLIFESDNINVPWNGYYKGELCQQGVYVWLVEGKFADGKPFKMAGDVTLLQ